MPLEIIALIVCGFAAVLLLVMLLRLRSTAQGLRHDVAGLRRDCGDLTERGGRLDADLRAERENHGIARDDVARLTEAGRHLSQTVDRLEGSTADLTRTFENLQTEHGRLQTAHAHLRADTDGQLRTAEERIVELKALRDDMTMRFKTLADGLLKDHGDRFGALNQERMTALLTPMREQVDHFQRELRDAHTGAAKDRERLKTEIEQLTRRSEEVSREAVALTNALKGDKQKQGAWGEMILERLLEDSGLAKGREYETQVALRDEDGGRRRPDVVVRLPGEKAVIIDAKVSLVAYEAAVNASDDETRQRQLRAHVAACRTHIDELATRDYASMVDGSVDYVLMFMPVEGALAAALEMQGDLTAYAISKRVGIATPTTLMMALRTIHHVWAVETRQRNAEEIADRAGKLHDKVAGVVEAFGKVGDHLGRAQQEHETALDRLSRGSGNVLGQVDKLRLLGARTNKPLNVEFDAEEEPAAVESDGSLTE